VDVTARPGSVHVMRAGTALVTIGALAALFGTPVLPIAVTKHDPAGTIAGATLLGGGLALLAAGIPLMVTGRTTYVLHRPDVALRF
jgi:hypothetical protein